MSAPVTRIDTFTLVSQKLRKPNSPISKNVNVAVSNFAYKIEVFVPNVHQPRNEDGTPLAYPILFALDGAAIFSTLCSLCTIVSNPRRLHPDMKPTAVVAVDYETELDTSEDVDRSAADGAAAAPRAAEGQKEQMKKQFHQFQVDKRTKDFTPVPTHHSIESDAKFGGADDFHTFLADELIPALRERYGPPVAEKGGVTAQEAQGKGIEQHRVLFDFDNMTLFGHSLAGLFAMHVFFHFPSTFHKYCAASPSLWFDDFRLVHELFAWEEAENQKQQQQQVVRKDANNDGALEEPPHYPSVVVTYGTKENLGPSQRTRDEMVQLKTRFIDKCHDLHRRYMDTVRVDKERREGGGDRGAGQLVHPVWCFEHPGEHHIMNFFSSAPKAVVLASSTSEEACKYLFNE